MSDPVSVYPPASEWERPAEVWVIEPPRRRLWLHIVLLLLTFLSTLVVGAHMQFNFVHHQPVFSLGEDLFSPFVTWIAHPSQLLSGIPFSLTLMLILLSHEMGHYLYARHYRVYATLPYFIPFPSLIGTLGAFIRIKSPIPSRAALFDIGIAGPIAGFIPACAAIIAGLLLSHPLAPDAAANNPLGPLPLAFHIAARVLQINRPLGSLSLHPIAAAGWIGLFATSLNLLPGGQLDGGHILFSVAPRRHRSISLITICALIPLGWYGWAGWFLWVVVLWLTSYHPSIPSRPQISSSRKIMTVVALLMLTLSLTPKPLVDSSGRDVFNHLRELVHSLRDRK